MKGVLCMLKLKNAVRCYGAVPCAAGVMSVTCAFAAEVDSSQTILTGVTTVLTWCLTAMTSIASWLINNPLGAIYIGMFIIGFAVALMFRVLHSA